MRGIVWKNRKTPFFCETLKFKRASGFLFKNLHDNFKTRIALVQIQSSYLGVLFFKSAVRERDGQALKTHLFTVNSFMEKV